MPDLISAVKNSILKKIYTFSIAFLELTISKKKIIIFFKEAKNSYILSSLSEESVVAARLEPAGTLGSAKNSTSSPKQLSYGFPSKSNECCPSCVRPSRPTAGRRPSGALLCTYTWERPRLWERTRCWVGPGCRPGPPTSRLTLGGLPGSVPAASPGQTDIADFIGL